MVRDRTLFRNRDGARAAHAQRGAADCSECREVAGALDLLPLICALARIGTRRDSFTAVSASDHGPDVLYPGAAYCSEHRQAAGATTPNVIRANSDVRFLGLKRTSCEDASMSVNDAKRICGIRFCCDALAFFFSSAATRQIWAISLACC